MASVRDLLEDHWLRVAHQKSIYHRQEIESSSTCGCFYCRRTFQPDEITEWVDESEPLARQTALCPYCGIDSVIGDRSGFKITAKFLAEMHRSWFSTAD